MNNRATDEFLIEAVEVCPWNAWIAMTPCPGRSRFLHWHRDLEGDFDAIAAWRAAAVVTLMRERELREPSLTQLRHAAEVRDLGWYHLPITDGGAPDGGFEVSWKQSGPALRAILRAGGRVLVHCQAGLGRSGTIAARLLVELGEAPATAIDRVRAARPGAIETDAQISHVRACRAIAETEG